MGASASSSVSIDMSTAVSQTARALTSTSQSDTVNAVNLNDFKLIVGGNVKNTTLTNNQSIKSNASMTTELTSNVAAAISSNLSSTLSAAVSQASSAQSGFLSTSLNNAENDANFKNAVSVALSSENINKIVQTSFKSTLNSNKNQIIIGGNLEGSTIKNDQDIASQLIASSIVGAVIDNLNATSVANGSDITVTQKADAKGGGLDSLVSALLGGMLVPVIISVVACVICVVVLLIVMNSLGHTEAGQHAIATAANTGQMYATGGASAFSR